MAQYTLTVKQLVENNIKIFNFDYPIFNEEYREHLENKIIRHFYFREIGFQTVGRFLYHLETKMNEIMPYYNQRYESTLFEIDPLINYQVKETYEKKSDLISNTTGDTTTDTTNTDKSQSVHSDTPQGRVDIIEQGYATDVSNSTGENKVAVKSTGVQKSDQLNNESFVRTMEGNIGVQTFSHLINDFRTTFINVDMEIIEELNELFMRVY